MDLQTSVHLAKKPEEANYASSDEGKKVAEWSEVPALADGFQAKSSEPRPSTGAHEVLGKSLQPPMRLGLTNGTSGPACLLGTSFFLLFSNYFWRLMSPESLVRGCDLPGQLFRKVMLCPWCNKSVSYSPQVASSS